jgi:HSP20 family molecular chaperone IbpA
MPAEDWNRTIWSEACALIERAEHLHRQFFRPSRTAEVCWEPPVDMLEDEHELLVIAALPGVRREDLDVHIDTDLLVVRGLRRMPSIRQGTTVRRLELPYGRFERRIALSGVPFRLQRLELTNGCLSLSLVKQF